MIRTELLKPRSFYLLRRIVSLQPPSELPSALSPTRKAPKPATWWCSDQPLLCDRGLDGVPLGGSSNNSPTLGRIPGADSTLKRNRPPSPWSPVASASASPRGPKAGGPTPRRRGERGPLAASEPRQRPSKATRCRFACCVSKLNPHCLFIALLIHMAVAPWA